MTRAKLTPLAAPQIRVETRQTLEQSVDFFTVDSKGLIGPARRAISLLISWRLRLLASMTFSLFIFWSRFTRQRLQRRLVKAVVDELLGLEIRSFFQENNFNLRPLHHSLWIESRNKSITHEIVKRSGNLPLIEPAVAHDDIDAPFAVGADPVK